MKIKQKEKNQQTYLNRANDDVRAKIGNEYKKRRKIIWEKIRKSIVNHI